jgi:hypothetical protein
MRVRVGEFFLFSFLLVLPMLSFNAGTAHHQTPTQVSPIPNPKPILVLFSYEYKGDRTNEPFEGSKTLCPQAKQESQ